MHARRRGLPQGTKYTCLSMQRTTLTPNPISFEKEKKYMNADFLSCLHSTIKIYTGSLNYKNEKSTTTGTRRRMHVIHEHRV